MKMLGKWNRYYTCGCCDVILPNRVWRVREKRKWRDEVQ